MFILRPLSTFIEKYLLPFGLLLLLTGNFFAPTTHDFRILVQNFLLLPCLLAILKCRCPRRLFDQRLVVGMVGTYLLYMASVSYFRIHDTAYFQWSFYIVLLLFGVGALMQLQWPGLARLLVAALITAALSVVYATIKDWHLIWHQRDYRMTGYGALYNPLRTGHLWGFFVIVGIFFSCFGRGWLGRRVILCCNVATFVCFIGILLTGSRSPLFGVLVSSIIAIFASPKGESRKKLLSIITQLLIIAVVISGSSFADRGSSLRPQIWAKAIQLTLPRVWFGCGMGCNEDIVVPEISVIEPHNNFVSAFYFGGLIGLALFTGTFASALHAQNRASKTNPLALLALLLQTFGLVSLLFDGGHLLGRPSEFWLFYWLPVAFLIRCHAHSAVWSTELQGT